MLRPFAHVQAGGVPIWPVGHTVGCAGNSDHVQTHAFSVPGGGDDATVDSTVPMVEAPEAIATAPVVIAIAWLATVFATLPAIPSAVKSDEKLAAVNSVKLKILVKNSPPVTMLTAMRPTPNISLNQPADAAES